MEREQRYIVLKLKDIDAARQSFPQSTCTENMVAFNQVCDAVMATRVKQGKGLLECAVVEKDWPEYDVVWQMIANRVDKKDEPIQKLFADLRLRFASGNDVEVQKATITRAEYNALLAAFSAWSIQQQNFPNIGEFPIPVDGVQ